jgi:hypothetical protein
MIVVLTAWFPQNRIGFLVGLAVWGGVCAFAATLFRNFASYAAALSLEAHRPRRQSLATPGKPPASRKLAGGFATSSPEPRRQQSQA